MEDAGLVPQLSLPERDRRYRLVRDKMAREGIDVLILPANNGRWEQLQADSRYLTSIGGFATEVLTIFPLEGGVTAYLFNRAQWWRSAQNWVQDLRDGRNRWAANVIERLKELGFQSGTLGISGLAGLFRAPDGIIPYTSVRTIQEALPRAKVVNATELMVQARSIKSEEEISFLERSASITEKAIETMTENARPGITEQELYASMVSTMLENGAELPTLFFLSAGPDLTMSSFVPTNRVTQKGDRVVNEIEAKYGGYGAQAVSPLQLGRPKPEYEEMVDLSAACFHEVFERMRPGVTFGELFDAYTRKVERHGNGKYSWHHPMMHARGLGDDGPALLGDEDLDRFRAIELQAGMVFVLKPAVRTTAGKDRASIGDTVAVTDRGPRRLGKRELKLIVVD